MVNRKRLIDKGLTAYQNVWLLVIGIVLFIFITFLLILNRQILAFVLVAIAVFIIICSFEIKEYRSIDKKIRAYKKITKKEYYFWRKHYKGLATYADYENYLRICDLPPEERDPFKDYDFSNVFKKR